MIYIKKYCVGTQRVEKSANKVKTARLQRLSTFFIAFVHLSNSE